MEVVSTEASVDHKAVERHRGGNKLFFDVEGNIHISWRCANELKALLCFPAYYIDPTQFIVSWDLAGLVMHELVSQPMAQARGAGQTLKLVNTRRT